MIERGEKTRQVTEKIGGASRDRTDDLIVANDALSQETSIWRALDSRLRSKTVQFKQARWELPHNLPMAAIGQIGRAHV